MLDISARLHRLCSKICADLPQLSHIDMNKVAVGVRQTYGNSYNFSEVAYIDSLRHQGGVLTTEIDGENMTAQRLFGPKGSECLYIIGFRLPRLYDCRPNSRLATVIHELWHISPKFNGYLRVFNHRDRFHGNYATYDRYVTGLAISWLQTEPPTDYYDFLFSDTNELVNRYGTIIGERYNDAKYYPEWDPDPYVKHWKVALEF